MSWLLHDLQSMRRAVSGLPMTLMNWSMIPHGIPAWLCSAPWHASAFCFSDSAELPDTWRRQMQLFDVKTTLDRHLDSFK